MRVCVVGIVMAYLVMSGQGASFSKGRSRKPVTSKELGKQLQTAALKRIEQLFRKGRYRDAYNTDYQFGSMGQYIIASGEEPAIKYLQDDIKNNTKRYPEAAKIAIAVETHCLKELQRGRRHLTFNFPAHYADGYPVPDWFMDLWRTKIARAARRTSPTPPSEKNAKRSGPEYSMEICSSCGGTGSSRCVVCSGTGRQSAINPYSDDPNLNQPRICGVCGGRGTIRCVVCGGTGRRLVKIR